MKLSSPTQPVWLIAVILGILGIVAHFVTIPVIGPYAFYLLAAGFVLLVLGTYLKGF